MPIMYLIFTEIIAGEIYGYLPDGCKHAVHAWKIGMLCESNPLHLKKNSIEMGHSGCTIDKLEIIENSNMKIANVTCENEGEISRQRVVILRYKGRYKERGKQYLVIVGTNGLFHGAEKYELCFRVKECDDKFTNK